MPAITSGVAPTGTGASRPNSSRTHSLLDSAGHVLGILYDPELAASTTSANLAAQTEAPRPCRPTTATTTAPLLTATSYLPTQLVFGVAGDIRAGTNAHHGWLGVTGTDSARPVAQAPQWPWVAPASPASGHLAPPARWWSRSTARPCRPWPSCGPASTC